MSISSSESQARCVIRPGCWLGSARVGVSSDFDVALHRAGTHGKPRGSHMGKPWGNPWGNRVSLHRGEKYLRHPVLPLHVKWSSISHTAPSSKEWRRRHNGSLRVMICHGPVPARLEPSAIIMSIMVIMTFIITIITIIKVIMMIILS